jgi:hypothetical protein
VHRHDLAAAALEELRRTRVDRHREVDAQSPGARHGTENRPIRTAAER